VDDPAELLLLILSLPSENATPRMRVWRALKALGCAVLRDGVYLLPARAATRAALAAQAAEVRAAGGTAWVLSLPDGRELAPDLAALFDRGADYAVLEETLARLAAEMDGLEAAVLRRRLKAARRDRDALAAIDYYPGPARAAALARLGALEARGQALLRAGEPVAGGQAIPPRDPADYRGRAWATRRDLWVDRLASAWLIRRFIDPEARLLWLDRPEDCPAEALGFDFDGATFSHAGRRVTFETLMASFGLEADAALMRLAAMVRALDVGGASPEAPGLEWLLRGMKARLGGDDDRLLAEGGQVLDDYYHAFREELNPP
jgi:hypothetical protein